MALLPKMSAKLRLRVTDRGEYELYCAVSEHRQVEVWTKLTVR